MAYLTPDRIEKIAASVSRGLPALGEEIKRRLMARAAEPVGESVLFGSLNLEGQSRCRFDNRMFERSPTIAEERIIGLTEGARPIARVRDNRATVDFVGPASEEWAKEITASASLLDRLIPAVGRLELTNGGQSWVGTAWLIGPDILVTNRHVAERFARAGDGPTGFVFRSGLNRSPMASRIDLLEEEDSSRELEHPVTEVLWISGTKHPDVAFLRVARGAGKPPLPPPIPLADGLAETDMTIVAIGYPAKDSSISDQELVKRIFGEVYNKKRLAPGFVMSCDEKLLLHDCSTLGGNSGSTLIDIKAGKAVGLHFGGYLDDTANTAVPALYLRELLAQALKRPRRSVSESALPAASAAATAVTDTGAITIKFSIPIEVTVKVGQPIGGEFAGAAAFTRAPLDAATRLDEAVAAAEVAVDIGRRADVVRVHAGYRFKSGWITDERVIVVEMKEKRALGELAIAGTKALPREFMGFGIDVRTAALADQLTALGVDLIGLERVSQPAGYREPPGYDDPNSDMALNRVQDRMDAIFHVSPDSAFPNLRDFLGRVEKTLTATMYEWDAGNHISEAIEEAIKKKAGNRLRMVTQQFGVANGEATQKAVTDMKRRLGKQFHHVWAATRGENRLVQGFYHIKVASRDGEEFWLSSGNWKSSNQDDIDPAGEDSADERIFLNHNREWHAIIKHAGLAILFQRYIEYDFDQAEALVSDEVPPGLITPEFFVPIRDVQLEAPSSVRFFDPLVLKSELIDVQPLLTPDRDRQGDSLFIKHATELVHRATDSICLQNQSLGMTEDDNVEMRTFYAALLERAQAGVTLRIIIRDAAEFGRATDLVRQKDLIERLKDFGFDTSRDGLRLQEGCHNKAIIVDAREVLFGSQNLTNGGALHNRDASLLIRSPASVAEYFQEIFDYDWDFRTHNDAEEAFGGIQIAAIGESTPAGFRRMSLSEILSDD